jgi:hypothetical protein
MFTDLEYILMVCCAVLLWRNAVLHTRQFQLMALSDRYANFLKEVGRGNGSVVRKDGGYIFKAKGSQNEFE